MCSRCLQFTCCTYRSVLISVFHNFIFNQLILYLDCNLLCPFSFIKRKHHRSACVWNLLMENWVETYSCPPSKWDALNLFVHLCQFSTFLCELYLTTRRAMAWVRKNYCHYCYLFSSSCNKWKDVYKNMNSKLLETFVEYTLTALRHGTMVYIHELDCFIVVCFFIFFSRLEMLLKNA